ncbi:UMF1 family MFS transporter [Rhodobacter aestuarii]|uniref:MFS transporter, UMF1 family n=1 Tax=Rhodobacter aestuarii TaxID=453582 RepID=A0A1N7LNL4_9RHOB|nr:MFS transporter [Rhodobacter aestuarii]PTV95137.1 UMF1 family MFS transporter [Rhodobacter aestuarii]SIS75382.1 MFS transporter, UMF1 family [Rhodobacter aestuarii]
MITDRKRIWGWWFFDWASQPYNTLLITFIFAPFMKVLLGDGTTAQTVWGYGVGAAGLIIALASPFLGAIADRTGRRLPFVWLFSLMYVLGAAGLWFAIPGDFSLILIMLSFAIGMIGMEFATAFTNAMLPDLAGRENIGKVSGSGWAFGYVGGLLCLIIMLTLLQANPETGKTLIGLKPILGLDVATREDTRVVGPLTALWYAVFMIPFFLWVREPRHAGAVPVAQATREAWPELRETLSHLPKKPSLFAYLAASMFYRDGLNGIYTFGGIYAAGVLNWSITQIGIFGILTLITGSLFAWLGGRADDRFGPKSVIVFNLLMLTAVVIGVVMISRDSVFGIAVPAESSLPDIAFFILGGLIGAGGGALQSASRTMMVRQSDPEKMTECFGLYALTGKATAFIAPISIGVVTGMTGSQSAGITPIIVLFVLGLILLDFVKSAGDDTRNS